MDILKEELAFFAEKKKELLRTYTGQFALIKGRALVGVFPTREQAYIRGVESFAAEPFLIKQIVEKETPEQVPLLAFGLHRARL
ncbi:MAG: hypothetical protein ACE5JD_08830 [Candidatus Methylomirabilia bacterium]